MNQEPNQAPVPAALISQLYLPPELLRIVEIAKDEKAPSHRLADTISANPLFATRLLRVVNFAPGLSRRVSTLSDAANALGLDNLKWLAFGLAAFSLDPVAGPIESHRSDASVRQLRDLWEHALGCAIIADRLAARVAHGAPLLAFTAGFVHDIGKLLLYRGAKQPFIEAVNVARENLIPSTETETLVLGTDHVKVGAAWGCQLEIPMALDLVLRYHHERFGRLPAQVNDDAKRLIALVQAADAVSEAEGIGSGGDLGEAPQEALTILNISDHRWRDQLRAIKDEVQSVREMFGFYQYDIDKTPATPRQVDGTHKGSQPQPQAGGAPGGRGVVIPFPSPGAANAQDDVRSALGDLSILVVEDNSSLRDLLSVYLRRHGYHVRSASDGASALAILARETIHVILLDLMLPRVDGFEVLRQIHRGPRDKTPYIIVVSAGAQVKDRQEVLNLGANEYMAKPFHLPRLLERVQSVEKFLL